METKGEIPQIRVTREEHEIMCQKILRGLELAYERMVEFKKYKKTPLVVWQDGKIVEIPYDQIPPTTKY